MVKFWEIWLLEYHILSYTRFMLVQYVNKIAYIHDHGLAI